MKTHPFEFIVDVKIDCFKNNLYHTEFFFLLPDKPKSFPHINNSLAVFLISLYIDL